MDQRALGSSIVLLVSFTLTTQGQESLGDAARRLKAQGGQMTHVSQAPVSTPEPSVEPSTKVSDQGAAKPIDDMEAKEFQDGVELLLRQEKFAELDQLASRMRTGKNRFKGGGWKLYTFYIALCRNSCEFGTDAQFQANIERLKRWVASRPESITARVALASIYYDYAWDARGEGSSDVVGDEGWRLFAERLQRARQELQAAALLKEKCPQWFLLMQRIGRSEGWELDQVRSVMNAGSAYEPLYYYFYVEHGNLLSPKWAGEPGDAERFAEEIARDIGGKQGATIYYKLATSLHCGPCGDRSTFSLMSWPKVQEGYAAMEQLYGVSSKEINELAHLASQAKDRPVALKEFMEIGENWDKGVWHTKSYFQYWRQWAVEMPPELTDALNEAEKTQAGDPKFYSAVQREFERRNSAVLKQCDETNKGDSYFQLGLRFNGSGEVQQAVAWPPTKTSTCLLPKLDNASYGAAPPGTTWVFLPMNIKALFGPSTGDPLPEAGN